MENEVLCACGCGSKANKGKWFWGHWNRGKKHVERAARGTLPPRLSKEEKSKRLSQKGKERWERFRAEHPEKYELHDCACGCGEKVRGTWAWGHHSRVKNVSKREDVREKRRDSFYRLHEEGKLHSDWNKGLTKETDERVAQNGTAISLSVLSDPMKIEKRSRRMSQSWKDGKIVPLVGRDHPQWKGGTSALTQIIRASGNLYREWRYPILKRDGFKCVECGKTGELNVHHDKERFCDILRFCVMIFLDATYRQYDPERLPELTWDEKKAVEATVVSYHVRSSSGEPVSGITLCYECHEKAHDGENEPDID